MLDYPPRRQELVLLAIFFEGGLALLAMALGWLIGCPVWQSLAIDGRDILLGIAATLPLLLIFVLCLHGQIGPLARIRAFAEEVLKPFFRPCTLFDLAAISVLAGLGEEMLFRGVLQEVFSRWIDPRLALALASLLFGLLHLITPTYAVLATVMGGYLGWLYLRSGNLLVPIIAHALYDFFALVYLVKGRITGSS